MGSTAFAQPAGKAQLRAKVKSAAEKLNDIASAAPDMIRAMFAGNTSSANLLALDEKSIAAEAELEGAVLAAQKSGALSDDETKELARLGDVAKRTRGPVKEDLETLKSVPDLPIVGRDAAVRLAPKSQQDEVINNAEAAKKAVGALVAAIRKLP
jgi:3-methyladenine DNA glycosylase AlkC